MLLAEFHHIDRIVRADKLPDDLFGDIPAYVFPIIRLIFLSLFFRFFEHLESIIIVGVIMVIVDADDQWSFFEL